MPNTKSLCLFIVHANCNRVVCFEILVESNAFKFIQMIRRTLRKRTTIDAAFQHEHFEPPAQRLKLSATSASTSSLQLVDLPTEILLQIVHYVPIWHRKNVRSSCKLLRDIVDHVVYRDARHVMETTGDRMAYEKAMITVGQRL